ncbi:hypothetical protein [Amphiplicatus metriothermophilus]|uniref:Uncharacterized protein n=1 Tax=Amphiplicatus metriothermophilus TaxID=1519374 RepID=A0A239PYV9_9PROT|nr:hypothetical protein [Amphiplicatus metriothermophilus]MBB5519956.1 hypothetical protein [Amphiplicatus metriothermophilus]SNT74857.1 hypothetical protein SAMN06297382_2447 [Amphiplicatus metriothermophilus]
MLNTARVALPAPVEGRLKRASEFVDNISDFVRDDLIGFRRPLAATFAFTAPIFLAFMFYVGGVEALAKWGALYAFVAGVGLFLVGRQLWPSLVDEFERRTEEKRKAIADLRCGFGEASFVSLARAPFFIEHPHGVLVLADAGDFRTLFFSIDKDEDDPRWPLYVNGELQRRVWRWLRLPVSREIVKFSTEGSKLAGLGAPPTIDSIDVWETVNVALGEPLDGAVIHRPFDEIVDMIDRMARF